MEESSFSILRIQLLGLETDNASVEFVDVSAEVGEQVLEVGGHPDFVVQDTDVTVEAGD